MRLEQVRRAIKEYGDICDDPDCEDCNKFWKRLAGEPDNDYADSPREPLLGYTGDIEDL